MKNLKSQIQALVLSLSASGIVACGGLPPVCNPQCATGQLCVEADTPAGPTTMCVADTTPQAPGAQAPGATSPSTNPSLPGIPGMGPTAPSAPAPQAPSAPSAPSTPAAPAPNSPAPSSPSGAATCEQSLRCLNSCQDQSCPSQCVEQASPSALQQLRAVFDCLGRTQCQGAACQQACGNELGMCLGTTQSAPSSPAPTSPAPSGGSLNCLGLYQCLNQCSDEACVNACAARSDQETVRKLAAVYECNGSATAETFAQQCASQIASCQQDA
ncbi:MAG: hypothetical protein HY791_03760 [Deltaproteobacteria bacterium]|nr:hypothetical protein [Deltaproteobacteria bacterium]